MKTLIHKSIALLSLLLLVGTSWAQTPGKVLGRVMNGKGEAEPGATVKASLNGVLQNGSISDKEGKYSIGNLQPGVYSLDVFVGSETEAMVSIPGFKIGPGETRVYDIGLPMVKDTTVVIRPRDEQLFTVDPGTRDDFGLDYIEEGGGRGISNIIITSPLVFRKDEGEPIQVRGARPGGTAYYMDGMKMVGEPLIPQDFIGSVSVLGGGIPAEYGDFTGGVIIVTTRNPGMKATTGTPIAKIRKEARKRKHTEKGLMFDQSLG